MRYVIIFIACILTQPSFAQQTVGTFTNTSSAYNGYTLFSPIAYRTTYLIDNCGHVINQWGSNYLPGMLAYLLEDGSLLRARNLGNTTFNAGGKAGGIERLDWNSNVLWEYEISSTAECSHHDVEYLPNGNVLFIVWEAKTSQEAIDAGRNPIFANSGLWPDKIVEVEPVGTNDGNIVWEWNSWDHLIQDFDENKDNFGIVAEHPELININYPQNGLSDWLHINAIDYNPILDQIVLSSHRTNELWIIDHSTTTLEAASHSGGNSGKGGDLLYRWGNPEAYDSGEAANKKFFGQHDTHWITEGVDSGKLMVFNNGLNRTPAYSSIDIIETPVDINGSYILPATGESFLPSESFWSFSEDPSTDFYSMNVSGAQRMPNGNTLICSGAVGNLFEISPNGDVVWEYQNPVGNAGPVEQGTTPVNVDRLVFRAYRYGPDYAGLSGRDLTPGDVIELNSTFTNCDIYQTTVGLDENRSEVPIAVYPNPATDYIIFSGSEGFNQYTIYDSSGRQVLSSMKFKMSEAVSVTNWPTGVYTVVLSSSTKIARTILVVQ